MRALGRAPAWAVALAAVGLLVPRAVLAQAPASDAPAPAPSAPPVTAPSGDDPWRDYDEAFRALVEGRRDDARRLVDGLAARAGDHPATARARALLRLWPAASAPLPSPAPSADAPAEVDEDLDTGGVERRSRGARAELTFFETFHGIAAGIEVCVLVECNSAEAALTFPLVLGGAALAITLASTPDGIRPGTASLLEGGVLWGTWNALALGKVENAHAPRFAGGLLLGQALGLGLGGTLATTVQPTSGQVSLSTTVGMWTGLLVWFSRGAGDRSTSSDPSLAAMLATSDIGLAAGALLSAGFPVSRGHALLIDSGGIGGALLGLGAVAVIGGNGTRWTTYYKAMVPSTLVGLAAATYLTRDWDVPELPVSMSLAPTPTGAGATLVVGGRF